MPYSYIPIEEMTDKLWEEYYTLLTTVHKVAPHKTLDVFKNNYRRANETAFFSRYLFIQKSKKIIGLIIFVVHSAERQQDTNFNSWGLKIFDKELKEYILFLLFNILKYYNMTVRIQVESEFLQQILNSYNLEILKTINDFFLTNIDEKLPALKNFASLLEKFPAMKIAFYKRIPDNKLVEYCDLFTETVRQIPDLNESDRNYTFTPKMYKEYEVNNLEQYEHLYILLYNENNKMVGLSYLKINLLTKDSFHYFTGIKKDYRGKGLGAILKASLYIKLMNEYPGIKSIFTETYDNNTIINNINKKLGFELLKKHLIFEVSAELLEEKLVGSQTKSSISS